MKFFSLDSPLMQGLNKLADLLWLNVLTLICCIPVITVGASLTAMHYMALKIVRGEECYITKGYWQSFRRNFKQATIIWLIMMFIILVLVGDFVIIRYSGVEFSKALQVVLMAIALISLFTSMFIFPLLAKFDNTVVNTIRNAFFVGVLQFPKTILMMVLFAIPPILFVLFPQIIPVVFLLGLSVPAWLSAKLYDKFFQNMEDRYKEQNPSEEEGEEDERIFRDELDESLSNSTNADV